MNHYSKAISEINDIDNQIEALEDKISEMASELIELENKLELLQIKRSNIEYDIDEML